MSSVLSSWFYILTLGIASLLLIALVFIFYKPSLFLQLTSVSGQLVDLTGMDDFDPADSSTYENAVIKVGANAYSISNSLTPILHYPFVAPLPSSGKSAADDVAGAKVTGTFMFWLLMLGIGFLTLLLAFIAVKYPAKLFGPQVSALVGCLPKTKSSCSSSSSCSAPVITATPKPVPTLPSVPLTPPPVVVTPPPPPPVPVKPVTPPPTPKPVAPTSSPGFTPAQLAVLQQIMAAMAVKSPTPTA